MPTATRGDACDLLPSLANGLCVLGPVTEPVGPPLGPVPRGVLVPQREVVCLPPIERPVREVCI